MSDALFWHRLQFAFTITYHYLFPQLTMGLAPFLVFWRYRANRGDAQAAAAGRFWVRIFGLNFAVGVVTGIPMEFQFGTNWAGFSAYAGGVVGQTLAMEGMFSFFLESAMIGAVVYGEGRLSQRTLGLATLGLAVGSWLSAFFILVSNAFMQHPQGHAVAGAQLQLQSLSAFLFNPWALVEFSHTMAAAMVTGAFVVAAVGAFYLLRGAHVPQGWLYVRHGTTVGLLAALLVAVPTGDQQAKMVARYQEPALAAMEGRFRTGPMAELTLIGQPNVVTHQLENPIRLPGLLSFLAYGTFHSAVRGLDAFPEDQWPTNIELLYYSFHVMAGLGTLMMALMALAVLQRLRGRLQRGRGLLWALMLAFPFPYIATTAGWLTAELGRQPWLVYGLFRTSQGASTVVSSGDALFTLIGFCGLYLALGLAFVFLVGRELHHGPSEQGAHG